MQLILGSSSPYRRAQLETLAYVFDTDVPNIDEAPEKEEPPFDLVARLSRKKAQVIAQRHPQAVVIGADQAAVVGIVTLGKPVTVARAIEQLTTLSGQSVDFLSAICVIEPGGRIHSHVEPTTVRFRALEIDEIEQYVALDQPLDCAGGIRSEGLGFHLIEQVESKDPSALIGLPLIALSKILRSLGINPLNN
ncbi:MAG: nucleoside triphosphate pyrophosphatase [Pseudomonadota bacterium]|nr:nucleoside triphosphate pyrophosphatase [Pseudomonadota bacterium]MEC9286517.1 nucleoside triphosphate pyrophosphatase [Pseudomonadota bacterium]